MLDQIKTYWQTIPSWIRNRYFIVLFLFAIMLLFLDTNNVFQLVKRQKKLKQLNKQELQMQEELEALKEQKIAFENDNVALEKFAREEYRMKKEDEDVFVIVEKGSEE